MNISMKGVSNKSEEYRGFTISWQEPPLTGAKWTANVASDSPQLNALMGRSGAQTIDGRTREDMQNTRAYVDGLRR
jgi:hypothetical protein